MRYIIQNRTGKLNYEDIETLHRCPKLSKELSKILNFFDHSLRKIQIVLLFQNDLVLA